MTSAHTAAASLSFVQIDTATARELVSRGVSEGAVRLFAHLHVHAKQTGESRASHRYLAEELGKSVRTVRLYLRQLREAGAIRGRRTGRASGYQVAALTGEGLQFRTATCCSSDLERERERKERVVRTPPPPAETPASRARVERPLHSHIALTRRHRDHLHPLPARAQVAARRQNSTPPLPRPCSRERPTGYVPPAV